MAHAPPTPTRVATLTATCTATSVLHTATHTHTIPAPGSMRAAQPDEQPSIDREAFTLTPAQETEMRRMDPNGDGIIDKKGDIQRLRACEKEINQK